MIHFRHYRNDDSPALAALWNRAAPRSAVARPLSAHEFDRQVIGGPLFEAAGLIVAARHGAIVGFAHAGFGPEEGDHPRPLRLGHALGSVLMLVVAPDADDPEVESGLLDAAERYLRERGATVLYAGGQAPLNPFYWGVYGGSECAGILADHVAFHRAVANAGYERVGVTILLEADLARPEPFNPRGFHIKRQTRMSVEEDALPASWWEALAVGDHRPTSHRLFSQTDDVCLARASTWDMTGFDRIDGRARLGIYDMDVHPGFRRKGYGRHLVAEILRRARTQSHDLAAVQTRDTNAPALSLYQAAGFVPVQTATLYRKPGGPKS